MPFAPSVLAPFVVRPGAPFVASPSERRSRSLQLSESCERGQTGFVLAAAAPSKRGHRPFLFFLKGNFDTQPPGDI